MTILNVGPNSTYATIAAAMSAAVATDIILLQPGYGNETAVVTKDGVTVSGDASSTGIFLQLGSGVVTFNLAGTAPINVLDALDGDTIVGNDGNNTITVTGGADSVAGGLGVDRLVVDYRLTSGAITGTTASVADAGGLGLVTITGGFEHFTILTGSGADTITTGDGDDIISTGDGASTVVAGGGANTIIGGSGADTVTALDGGNIIDGGGGDNTLTSGGGNDTITGGLGVDTIVAGGGDDLVTVRGGADTSNSGTGNDRLVVNYADSTTSVTGGVSAGDLTSGYSGTIADGAGNSVGFLTTENFTVTTGSGNDNIKTGDGLDVLIGGAGDDQLDAGGGNDDLDGGSDDDELTGGGGNDAIDGGDGTDTAVYTGARSDYTITYTSATEFEVTDNRVLGVDGTDTLTGVEFLRFNDVTIQAPQPPVITSDGGGPTASRNVAENTTAVTMVTATDPDAGAVLDYSIVGGADQALFTIDATTGALAFLAAPDRESPTDAGTDNTYDVTVRASDGYGGHDDQAIAVTVTNVNEVPVITSDGGGSAASLSVAENSNAVTTVTATDPDLDIPTFTLAGGADEALFSVDSVTGALAFIAAPDHENPTDAGLDNTYDVIVRASDGNGGQDDQAIAVTITPVNDAPTAIDDAATVAEGGTAAAINVLGNDSDVDNTLTAASITGFGQASNGTVTQNLDGTFSYAHGGSETTSDSFTYTIDDGAGGTDTATVNLTITPVNDAPTAIDDAATVAEGGTAAAINVLGNDSDVDNTLTAASITGFGQASNGTVTQNLDGTFSYAHDGSETTSDSFTYTIDDGAGGTDTATVNLTITPVNDAPTAIDDAATVAEGGTAAAINVLGNDSDVDNTLTAASITGFGQASNGTVTQNLDGTFSYAHDGSETTSDSFTYTIDDGAGGTDTATVNLTITPVNDAPVITSDGGGSTASLSVAENSTAVTTLAATDPDAGAVFVYSMVGGADQSKFSINASTGVLAFIAAPDRENPTDAGLDNTYDVIVRASDGNGGQDDQAIAVTVTNVNEVPVITSDGGGSTASLSVAENSTAVTTLAATDPDAGAVFVYSMVGGADQSKFSLNAATGVLAFIAAPDRENPTDAGLDNTYDVIVRASDGNGGQDDQAIAVTVTNVNEVPVITSDGGGSTASLSVAENSTAVTTLAATDPDAGAVFVYSMVGGADQSKFSLNAATGVLAFIAAPDRENPTDAGLDNTYDVIVRASDGNGGQDDQAIAVTVINQNEGSPPASNDKSMAENGMNAGTVTFQDLTGQTVAYAIAAGVDGAHFTINSATGALTFKAGPDFEEQTDGNDNNVYDVNVTGTHSGGASETRMMHVTVTNVDGNDIKGTKGADVVNVKKTIKGQLKATGEEDSILGRGGNDKLSGLGGNDNIVGGKGKDKLNGNAGDDVLNGGRSNDKLGGQRGDDTLKGGSGSDKMGGNAGNDHVSGGAGADKLRGNAGDDVLGGGGGKDILKGGAGVDTFYFSDGIKQSDIVKDFAAGETVLLSKNTFSNLGVGQLSQADFDDHFAYKNGKLSYDADGAGGDKAFVFAIFSNKADIGAADLFVA